MQENKERRESAWSIVANRSKSSDKGQHRKREMGK